MQGQGLRDRVSEFSELGAVVVGASFDTVEEQKKFVISLLVISIIFLLKALQGQMI